MDVESTARAWTCIESAAQGHRPFAHAAADCAAGTGVGHVLPIAETNISSGQDRVRLIHAAVTNDTGVVGVDGSGAFANDVYVSFALMLALIALATVVPLARAFRSLLLPLKAVVLNLASLAAAYGVMVLVRQGGTARTLCGASRPPAP
jgi:putative drug exporter of the RND superfamily